MPNNAALFPVLSLTLGGGSVQASKQGQCVCGQDVRQRRLIPNSGGG